MFITPWLLYPQFLLKHSLAPLIIAFPALPCHLPCILLYSCPLFHHTHLLAPQHACWTGPLAVTCLPVIPRGRGPLVITGKDNKPWSFLPLFLPDSCPCELSLCRVTPNLFELRKWYFRKKDNKKEHMTKKTTLTPLLVCLPCVDTTKHCHPC